MIKLKTARLIIRNPRPSDKICWHHLLSDNKTMYYLQDIQTNTIEESQANLEEAIEDAGKVDRKKYFFAVEIAETNEFIGSMGYTVTNTTPVGKFADLGYFISPQYHGQGYTTEAVREILRFAFENDGVYRISTGCNAENKASERVMQKCGMIKEAELKLAVWHDGRLCDRLEYRLLRDEWIAINRK